MQNPLNYVEPPDPDYFCSKESSPDRPPLCTFPQDIRSLSFWGKNTHFFSEIPLKTIFWLKSNVLFNPTKPYIYNVVCTYLCTGCSNFFPLETSHWPHQPLQSHWPQQPLQPYFLNFFPHPDDWIISGTKMTITDNFLWNGSSKI